MFPKNEALESITAQQADNAANATIEEGQAPSAKLSDLAEREQGYDFVDSSARIAVYDDLLSSPQIIDIEPNSTREFINELATSTYNSAKLAGGTIPYSIILQVAENFIHSRFQEVVVSVLDDGNTIRFSDQGPGIADKEKAQQPGYSSATAPMKRYINGVGSGLPIVREYMETKHGTIRIEDNLNTGAVVTISLKAEGPQSDPAASGFTSETVTSSANPDTHAPYTQSQGTPTYPTSTQPYPQQSTTYQPQAQPSGDPIDVVMNMLSPRSFQIIKLFNYDSIWGVKDIASETEIPTSSTHAELKKLEEAGIMTRLGKKYRLTELGERVALNLS